MVCFQVGRRATVPGDSRPSEPAPDSHERNQSSNMRARTRLARGMRRLLRLGSILTCQLDSSAALRSVIGLPGSWRTQIDTGLSHKRLDSSRRKAPEEVFQQVLLPWLTEDHPIYRE